MHNLSLAQPKAQRFMSNTKAAAATLGTAMMMAPFVGAFCSGDLDNLMNAEKVTISVGALKPSNMLQNVITIIATMLRIIGAFMILKGFTDFLTAKQDENSVNESKAVRLMALAFVFLVAPSIFQFIFNGATIGGAAAGG